MKTTNWMAIAALIFGASACTQSPENNAINIANMDTTISPGEDFYTYVNGNWLKNNPIPNEESRWGSFNELQEFNNSALKSILEDASKSKDAVAGSNLQKIGDFYATGMDTAAIEAAGMSPLKSEIDKINAIGNKTDLVNAIARLHRIQVNALFGFYVYIDEKQSDAYTCYANQGGLGLPDRDYYLNTDDRSKNICTEYKTFLSKLFELSGADAATAQKNAEKVFNFELNLAKNSRTRVELRDPQLNYNKMSVEDLNKTYSSLAFSSLLTEFGLSEAKEVVIGQPAFFKAANDMVANTSIEEWKLYLNARLMSSYASFLSSDFVNASFNFYGKVLQGTKELKPRYKRMISYTDDYLGEALGEIYVKKYFSEEAKKRAYEMVNNIASVFGNRIKGLDWMSDETKTQALEKLGTFIKKLGYPDAWKDYSALNIEKTSFVENVIRAREFQFADNVSKFGKPVDKMEWLMTPPTVNAYYNPVTNEISFPAGILQTPFFDASADDAVNYGGIGAVIGHEITHGFDDQGRQYDAAGNLKDWWSEEDGKKFMEKANAVEVQYNNFIVLDSVHVNGKLTMGENIADLGGLSIAYEAYTMTEEFKKGEKINGFTPAQRFFISWAQVWRNNIRDEALAQRIVTDPHSPGIYRANGPLTNMPEFYSAFGVKEGDKMWKPEAERAKIW